MTKTAVAFARPGYQMAALALVAKATAPAPRKPGGRGELPVSPGMRRAIAARQASLGTRLLDNCGSPRSIADMIDRGRAGFESEMLGYIAQGWRIDPRLLDYIPETKALVAKYGAQRKA